MTILPIASGKGGVGKTALAANLGIALARAGRTVILVDLDLGGSNLHTFLGLRNRNPGLGAFVTRKAASLDSLLAETGTERLWLIPGDNLVAGAANPDYAIKRKLLKGLCSLVADFVVLDLGAGASYNVVDFFLLSQAGIVVCVPEVTSVLNAYSFLKTCAYRELFRAFKPDSPERMAIAAYGSQKTEGSGSSLMELVRDLNALYPSTVQEAYGTFSAFRPRVVVNMAGAQGEAELGGRLHDIVAKNLGLGLDFLGAVPRDPSLPASLASLEPAMTGYPDSPFSRAVVSIAARLLGDEGVGAARDPDAILDGGLPAPGEEGVEA